MEPNDAQELAQTLFKANAIILRSISINFNAIGLFISAVNQHYERNIVEQENVRLVELSNVRKLKEIFTHELVVAEKAIIQRYKRHSEMMDSNEHVQSLEALPQSKNAKKVQHRSPRVGYF